MGSGYTKARFDFDRLPWMTSAFRKLGLTGAAIDIMRLPAGEGYTFTHEHRLQEEVYMVIEGSGAMYVDGDVFELERGDMVRVAPSSRRALKASVEGMLVISAGAIPMGYPRNPNARYMFDDGIPHYDDVPPWYRDDEGVVKRNRELAERMARSRAKREGSGEVPEVGDVGVGAVRADGGEKAD